MKREKKIKLTDRQRQLLESELGKVTGGAGQQAEVDAPSINESIDAVGAAL